MSNYHMGMDGFVWFTAVVEDRNDPAKLGRVRIRCLGLHTEDKLEIPTESLPWAHVMHTIHDPSMQGMGTTPSFLVEGTWVIGFFRDATEMQQPVVMGTLPGYAGEIADTTKGFCDPSGTYPQNPNPKSGHNLGESDVNRLARGDGNYVHRLVDDKNISTSSFQEVQTAKSASWGLPNYASISKYPYNHVFESESGHVREFDDTEFEERIHEYHRSGTYYEIDAGGNKVTYVVGNNYEVIVGSNYVSIKGDVNLTIDGNCNTLVKEDYNIKCKNLNIEVEEDFDTYVKGNTTQFYGDPSLTDPADQPIFQTTALGAVSQRYDTSMDFVFTKDVTYTYGAKLSVAVTGAVTEVYGSTIDRSILGVQTDIHAAAYNINSTGGGVNINSVDELKLFSTEVDLKASSGITLDASDVNINSGGSGDLAARKGDTADQGDDPAGISGSDGSNVIETGSATVKIGSADPGVGTPSIEASTLVLTEVPEEDVPLDERVDTQGPDNTEGAGTGGNNPPPEGGGHAVPAIPIRDIDPVATIESELGISGSGMSSGEAESIIQGRNLERAFPDPDDPTGKKTIVVSDPDENEARETEDSTPTGSTEPNRNYLNIPPKSGAWNPDTEITEAVRARNPNKFFANGNPKIIWLPGKDSRVKSSLLKIMENVADDVGYPLTITSGYRSPAYNKLKRGAKKSLHMQGKAMDVRMRNKTKSEILKFVEVANKHGIRGIGLYFPAKDGGNFIHCDIRSGYNQWGPNGSLSGQYSWANPTMKKLGFNTRT